LSFRGTTPDFATASDFQEGVTTAREAEKSVAKNQFGRSLGARNDV